MATTNGPLDALPQQVLPTAGKILPSGSRDERRLKTEVDLTIAWAEIRPARTPARQVVTDSLSIAVKEPCRTLILESEPRRKHVLLTRIRVGRGDGQEGRP
jgi:hypothetical protein